MSLTAPATREPVLLTLTPRKAAIVRIEVPVTQLGEAIGTAIGEITSAIAASSLFPIGGPFTHYLRWDGEMVIADVGFPVTGDIVPRGRVVRGALPGGTVASALHVGPYGTIGDTYGRMKAWIRARGSEPGPTMWEVYRRGPSVEPDPAAWQTEVCWPVG
jgi:effector-binding domain-containing protein